MESFVDLQQAMNELMNLIKDREDLLKEYPKSNWGIGYIENDTWVQIYKISSAKIRKLQKLDLF